MTRTVFDSPSSFHKEYKNTTDKAYILDMDSSESQAQYTHQTQHWHAPMLNKRQPITTYRLQMSENFTFEQAEAILPYLTDIGVTDMYLSPILQAAPGSTHGYDIVDHSRISDSLGGRSAFEKFSRAAHKAGFHIVVDVVPNHMAVPTPLYHNRALWSALRDGDESPYKAWFDSDVNSAGDGVLMPVLGDRIGNVLARQELSVEFMLVPGFEHEGTMPVLRYFDHVFPLRAGTEDLPLAELVDSQFYRLAYWRVANEELNYRRFFDVDTLVAIRVEDDEVFRTSHALLLELFNAGLIDAFRIDHPDGLADPREYLRKLHQATGGAWIVAEKILEGDELPPSDWQCSGTTGYDALRRIQGLFTDPTGIAPLAHTYVELSGNTDSISSAQAAAKSDVIVTSLYAEIDRLSKLVADICHRDVRLRDHTFRSLRTAISQLAIHMDRYRAYVIPGETPSPQSIAVIEAAAERARLEIDPEAHDSLNLVTDLFLGREVGSASRIDDVDRHEAIVRFQQLTGPVIAKGVEDTVFYRYTSLLSANEVGSGPEYATCTPDEFHAWQQTMHQLWPASAVTLTTHDTKRGEDVRARIAVLSEYPYEWQILLAKLRASLISQRPENYDGQMEILLWETLIGTWQDDGPIEFERLKEYLLKAAREQKTWTSWTQPHERREQALLEYAQAALTNDACTEMLTQFHDMTAPAARTIILGQKVLQMTMVGVTDLYQGEEIDRDWLVDPDNRQPVDFHDLHEQLRILDESYPAQPTLSQEKLWVTSRMARLRRAHPYLASADSDYIPLPVTTGHVTAFARTKPSAAADESRPVIIALISRLYRALSSDGTFDRHSVVLPDGRWRNILTGAEFDGGAQLIHDIMGRFPAAALERIIEDRKDQNSASRTDARLIFTTAQHTEHVQHTDKRAEI